MYVMRGYDSHFGHAVGMEHCKRVLPISYLFFLPRCEIVVMIGSILNLHIQVGSNLLINPIVPMMHSETGNDGVLCLCLRGIKRGARD